MRHRHTRTSRPRFCICKAVIPTQTRTNRNTVLQKFYHKTYSRWDFTVLLKDNLMATLTVNTLTNSKFQQSIDRMWHIPLKPVPGKDGFPMSTIPCGSCGSWGKRSECCGYKSERFESPCCRALLYPQRAVFLLLFPSLFFIILPSRKDNLTTVNHHFFILNMRRMKISAVRIKQDDAHKALTVLGREQRFNNC